jgi:DNA-binding transcriptional LysR family regulator
MDAAHLEAFVTVVDLGSFTRAASRLRLSQPSVTTRVQALETEVGAKLLNRLYRSVSPTPAGLDLLPLARDILRLTRLARAVAQDDFDSPRGRITIASSECVAVSRLPPVIDHVLLNYPALEMALQRASTDDCLNGLRGGQFDCAFVVDTPQEAPGFERHVLNTERLSVLAAPHHHLAGAAVVTTEDLVTATWVRSDTSASGQSRLMASLGDVAPAPRTFVLESLDAVKRVVGKGLGVAVMPSISAHEELSRGILVELPWHPPFEFYAQMIWRRDVSRTNVMRRIMHDFLHLLSRDATPGEAGPSTCREALPSPDNIGGTGGARWPRHSTPATRKRSTANSRPS